MACARTGELAPGVPLPPPLRQAPAAVRPTALALLSPWTDLTSSLPTYTTRAWAAAGATGDPVFSDGDPAGEIASSVECSRRYGGRCDLADPRISPVFLPPPLLREWLPPTLLVVGDAEVMAWPITRASADCAPIACE